MFVRNTNFPLMTCLLIIMQKEKKIKHKSLNMCSRPVAVPSKEQSAEKAVDTSNETTNGRAAMLTFKGCHMFAMVMELMRCSFIRGNALRWVYGLALPLLCHLLFSLNVRRMFR